MRQMATLLPSGCMFPLRSRRQVQGAGNRAIWPAPDHCTGRLDGVRPLRGSEDQMAYENPRSMQKRNALVGSFGLIGGIVAAATTSEPSEDEHREAREAAYEEVLRLCLRGEGLQDRGAGRVGICGHVP